MRLKPELYWVSVYPHKTENFFLSGGVVLVFLTVRLAFLQ